MDNKKGKKEMLRWYAMGHDEESCVSMGPPGSQRVLMGTPWVPMGSHGTPWGPMGTHGFPWVPMDPHGFQQIRGEVFVYPIFHKKTGLGNVEGCYLVFQEDPRLNKQS